MRILFRISVVLLLALISLLGFGERPNHHAKGFVVDVATVSEQCGDGRDIVAMLIGNHRVKLNEESDVLIEEVAPRLREVMKFRAEKLIYVKAVADVDFREFAELVDSVRPEVQVISLILPQVDALVRGNSCLVPSCGRCEKLRNFAAVL